MTLSRAKKFSKSKIRDLGIPLCVHQDVAGLDISVNNLRLQSLMQICQSAHMARQVDKVKTAFRTIQSAIQTLTSMQCINKHN